MLNYASPRKKARPRSTLGIAGTLLAAPLGALLLLLIAGVEDGVGVDAGGFIGLGVFFSIAPLTCASFALRQVDRDRRWGFIALGVVCAFWMIVSLSELILNGVR